MCFSRHFAGSIKFSQSLILIDKLEVEKRAESRENPSDNQSELISRNCICVSLRLRPNIYRSPLFRLSWWDEYARSLNIITFL